MLKKTIVVVLVGIMAYLLMWPVPMNPHAWQPPTFIAAQGQFQLTDNMAVAQRLWEGKVPGPEGTAIGPDGMLYTGLENGDIVRMSLVVRAGEEPVDKVNDPDIAPKIVGNTGGRPLGIQFDAEGNLIITDAHKGLLSMAPDGAMTLLTNSYGDKAINVADDLDIASDGKIYFTDVTATMSMDDLTYMLVEGNADGVLLSYDPASGETLLEMDGLRIGNGVALGPGEEYIIIPETVGLQIKRLWLKGPLAGQVDTFVDNLPGWPDNVTFNGRDTFWVALAYPRHKKLEALSNSPFQKKLMMRLPKAMAWVPEFHNSVFRDTYGMFVGIDLDGNISHFSDAHSGHIGLLTSVLEHQGQLYLGSLVSDYIGSMPVPSSNAISREQ